MGDIIYQSGNRDTVLSIINPNTGDSIISYIFETPVQDVGSDLELDSDGTTNITSTALPKDPAHSAAYEETMDQ